MVVESSLTCTKKHLLLSEVGTSAALSILIDCKSFLRSGSSIDCNAVVKFLATSFKGFLFLLFSQELSSAFH